MKLVRPRAILFDWDNTLVDNWGSVRAALNAALVAHGQAPWTIDETRQRVRRSLRETFPDMFGDKWKDARAIFYKTFEAEHLDTLAALPGAADALALFARDVPLAVVSNKQGRLLRREADKLGWTGYFRRLIGATDAPRDKPDRAPVDLAAEGIEIPYMSDIWFIGDTALDMQTAHAAGCVPVLFGRGEEDQDGLARYAPRFQVDDWAQLQAMWRGLETA